MNIKKNGFTLMELIVAMGVGLVIMAAVYSSMNMAQRSSVSVGRKVVTQQDARTVLDLMAMEIRMASYNPVMSPDIWSTIPSNATTCTQMGLAAPDPNNKGIQIATANKILIAMDLTVPPNGVIGAIGDSNEYIMYSYNGTYSITRNVSCGSNQPILGGADSATLVRNDDQINPLTNNKPMPLFQYFNNIGTNLADITGAVPSASIPAIRRIRITIVADTENSDSLTGKVKRMTYTTDVLVKNHVLCP